MSNSAYPILQEMDASVFLRDYWQKQPLLIRNAIPGFESPVSAEELAGLACEADIESRLVLEKHGRVPWELRHGPFEESDFEKLPETHWTLLVQECNKYVDELAMLLEEFSFIPNWRVDDVMVSYASPQGSVGPHLDQYDVFLLQAHGERRWQINQQQYGPDDFIKDCDLRILSSFEAEQEWVLNPGDMLYLPPGIAHYGVAVSDCLTISIGFRAPNYYQIFSAFIDDRFSDTEDFYIPRLTDPDLKLQASPGLIESESLEKVVSIFKHYTQDDTSIKRWFARFITEPGNEPDMLEPDKHYNENSLRLALDQYDELYRSENAKFAYINVENQVYLYINGIEFPLPGDLSTIAALFCDRRRIAVNDIKPLIGNSTFCTLLLKLINKGYYYFPG